MSLESGVSGYKMGVCEVHIGFPVDEKGKAYVACKYCDFFVNRHCVITNEIVPFPETHIGNTCPLGIIGEEKDDDE